MCIYSIECSGGTLAIVAGESLTEDDVRVVCESLSAHPQGANVVLDLRRLRTEEGSAAALLLRVLERSGTPYSFVGLNRVHDRVLRYLAPELVGRIGRDPGAR